MRDEFLTFFIAYWGIAFVGLAFIVATGFAARPSHPPLCKGLIAPTRSVTHGLR